MLEGDYLQDHIPDGVGSTVVVKSYVCTHV